MTSDISSCASHSPFIPSRPVVAVLKDALTNGTDNYQAELLQIEDAVKRSGYGGDDALQVSRDLVSCIEKDDKRLEECLRKLLNIVEPFDVASMMKVFISSKDSINAAKGKHVVVIAGRTGTGKTVTLHYLSGSKLEKNQQRKVVVIQAAAGTEGCKVGSGSSSCTAYLQSVPCVADANVVLLDTVGWGDTKGDEIEAACNAVLGAALRECASVRFLLIIDSGFAYERCKPLKATIKDFCNLVNPTHLNDVVKCTTFGITRFKAEPFVDECIADVEELFSSNGNLTNNEKLICKLLTDQLESGIQIIDPEREWSKSPKEVLEAVLKSEPLRTPESAFRVPLSQDLRQKLGHQLQVYNEAVQRLLESSDHERAVEIIEIIEKLRMMFDDPILLKTMNECLRKVERMVSDILKKASRNLDSYFAKYPQYVVTPETIIQISREVQGLRRYFAESFPDIGWDEVNVEQQAEQYVESVHMGTPEEMGTAVRKCRELMGLGMLSVDKSLSLVHDNIRKQFNSFSKKAIVGIDEMSSVKEMIKQLEACCHFASIADGSCSYKEVVERFSDKLEDKLMSAKLAVEKLPVGNEALSGLLDFLMRVTEKQEKLKELQVEVKYLERGLRNLGDHVEEIFKKATSTMGGADAEMYLSIGKVLERSWGHDYQSRKESSFVQVECAVQKFLDGDVSDVYRCIRSVGHPLACDADLAGSFVWNQKCERTWDHLSKLQQLVELVRGVLPLTAAMVEKRLIAPRIDDLGKLCDGIEKTLEGPMGRVHCLEEVRDKYIAADPRLLLLQKLGVLGDIVDCESDDAQKILNDRRERMQNKIINIEKGITAVGEKLDSRRNLFDDSNIETAEEANDIIEDFDMRIPKAEGKLRSLESVCNQCNRCTCKSQKKNKLDANGYKNITELRQTIQDKENEVDQMTSQREEYQCVLKELANINKIPAEVDPEMHQGLGLEEVLTRLKNQLDEHQRQQRDVDAQLKVLKNDVVSREAASVLREARISSVFDLVTELRDKKMEARESTYTELGSEGLQELETVLDAKVEFRRAAVLRDDLIRRAKSVAERKAFEAVKSIKEVCNMIIGGWKSESAVQVVQLVDDVFRFFNSMPEVYKRHSFDKLKEPLMGALETVRNLRFNDDPDRLFFARSCYVVKLLSESTAVEVRNMFDPLYKKSEQDLEDMLEHSMPEKIDEAELDIVEEKLALYGQLDAAHRATFKSQNVKKNLLAKVKKQLEQQGIVAVPGSDSAFFREMREGQRQLRIAKRVKELLSESQAKQLEDVCNRMREHFSSLLWEKLKSMNTSGESCVKLSEKLEMFSEFRDLMTEEVALYYQGLHTSERTVTDDILEALVENDPLEWKVDLWRDLKRMEAEGLNRETKRKTSENIRKTYLDKILDETLVTKLRKMKDHLSEMGTFEHLADELKEKLDNYMEQSSAKGQVLLTVKHDNYEMLWNTDSKLPSRSIVNEMKDLLRDEEEKYMSGEKLSRSDVILALHCKELAGDSNVPAMKLMQDIEEIFKKATSTMGGADAEMYLSIGKVLERSWGHDYQSRKESSFVQVECAVQKFLDGDVSDVYRCIRSVGHPLACDADLAGSFVWNQKCERTWDHLSKLQQLVELVRGVLPLTAAMVEKRLIAPRIDDLGKLCDGIEKTLEGPMGRVHCLEEVRDKYIAADPRLLLLQKLGVLGDIVDCESDDAQKILNDRRERMQNKIINIEKGITAVGEKLDSRRNLFDDSNIETAEEANDIIEDFDMRIPKAEGTLRSLESLCNQCKSQKRKKLDADGYKNITELRKVIQDEKNEVNQMISQREEYQCVLKELANINKIPAEVDPEMHQGLGLEEVLTRLKNQLDEHQRQQRDVDAQLKVLKNNVVSREAASVLREARISSVFDLVTELRDKKMEARESTYTELGSEGLQELETVLDAKVEFRRAAVLRDDLIRRAKSVAEKKAFEAVKSIKEVCNMIIDEWKSESAVQVVQLVDDVFKFFNSMPEVYKRHSFDKLREPLMGALETVRNLRFNDDPDRLFFARSCYVVKLLSESTAVEVRNMFDPLYKKSEQDLEDMLEHSMPEKIDEAELDIVEEKLALYGQLDAAHRATFKSQNVKKNLLAKVKKQLEQQGIVAVPGSDSAFFREMREGQRQLRIAKRVKELLSESQAKQLEDVCNRMREHFSSLLWEKLKSMNTSGESCVKLSEKLEMFSEFRDLMTEEVALYYQGLHTSERTVTDDILEALVENDPLEWKVDLWRDLKRMEAEGLNRETKRKTSENIRKTYLDKILDETLVTKLRKMKDHLSEMGTFEPLADELKDKLDDYTSKLDQEQSSAKSQVLLAVKHDNYEMLWNTDSKLPRRSIVNEMNDLLRDGEEKYISGETLSCSDVLLALHCKELAGDSTADSNVPAMRLMRQACNSDLNNKNWKGILFWVTCLCEATNYRDHTFVGKFLESCGLPPVFTELKRSFSDLKESMNGVLRDNTFTHLEHISDKWSELEDICETLATVWKQSSGLPDGIPCAEILKLTGSVVPKWSKWKDDVVKKVNENQQNIAEKGSELVNSFLATQDAAARKQLNEELTKSITALQSITKPGADVVGLAAVPEIKYILSKEITKLREKAIKGIREKDWVKVNQIIESLSALRNNAVSFVADAACPVSAEVEKAATDKLGKYLKLQHTNIVECLIGMQQMSDSVEMLRVVAQKHITAVLKSHVKSYGPKKLPELVHCLRSHKSGIGELLVTEHQIFKSFSIQLWKERAGKRDIKDVMEDLHRENPEMSKDEISKLRKAHDFVMEKTESYIREHYLGGNSAVKQLVKKTKQMGFDIANKNVIRKFAELFLSNDGLLDLVAHVSAIWTLKGSDRGSKESEFLRKLHSIQVLAIVRSLGSKTFLEGSFVQVSTGEGKSVVLSILAAVCSLLGITPYVVCHSSYLSTRDEDDSSDFLKELDVGAFYGTINQCCEDVLRGKALREAGEGLLNGDKPQVTQLDRVKRILLIDEVDVFMSESFYGQVYLPSMKRSAADLKPLTDFLWENKDNEEKMKWNQVRVLKEFEDAAAALSICGNLFNEAVRSMIEDLKYFKKASDYVVTKEDDGSLKIGYVEQDCIDYTRVDEYRTLWAIYEAYHRDDTIDEITRECELRQEVYLLFKLGEYSYMDLARDEFSNIIGVSGTLPQSSSEKDIVKDLGIKYQTVMPSMYGPSNLKFDERNDVQAEESGEVHYSVVLREIKMRLGEGKRSVLVLFESEQQIGDYMKRMEKTEDEKTLRSIQRMVEGNTHSERMARTKRATTPGVVTFAVRVLGRGTDFYVTMQSMLDAGGMHVIQTFMGSMSEHLQIKGRTARQGQVGSFSMIIDIGGLDTFGISRSVAMEQTKNKTLYKFLCDASTDHHTKMLQLQIIDAKGSTKEHRHSMDFRSELLGGKLCKKSFVDKLLKWNRGPKYEKATSRTVILLDGTGSMSNLIHGAKAVLREVFERIYFILEEADNSLLSFSIQIVVYRNYNRKLLQLSKWCDTAGDLCAFLQDVKAEGGHGNEAVEIGLNHVNNEDNVAQVILMGDAPANTDANLTYLGSAYNVTVTDWKTETRALADKEIPVHSFYLAPWAKENFNEISSMTSGECKRLDVSSSSAADEMTDLWSLRVLEDIGGDVLVSQYRKRYASRTS